MGTSHVLAAPGLRTNVATGWRADIASIVTTVGAHSQLIVLGMIGFALRGGIIFLTVPILVLPTSVEVRLLLGGGLGPTGLTSGFYLGAGLLSILTLAVALVILYTLARCETGMYARFVKFSQPNPEHVWARPGALDEDERSLLGSRMFVVETATLIAILLAAVPLAVSIAQSTYEEIVLPSSGDSLYARILNDVTVPLLGFLLSIVVIEAISAIVKRRVLASSYGLRPYNRLTRHPLRVVGVAITGWILFVGIVGISFVVLNEAWQVVESVFLSTGLSGDLRDLTSAVLVTLIFGALFTLCLLACGIVSTVRSGLWTLASLR